MCKGKQQVVEHPQPRPLRCSPGEMTSQLEFAGKWGSARPEAEGKASEAQGIVDAKARRHSGPWGDC